jgi:hypothetical protein
MFGSALVFFPFALSLPFPSLFLHRQLDRRRHYAPDDGGNGQLGVEKMSLH